MKRFLEEAALVWAVAPVPVFPGFSDISKHWTLLWATSWSCSCRCGRQCLWLLQGVAGGEDSWTSSGGGEVLREPWRVAAAHHGGSGKAGLEMTPEPSFEGEQKLGMWWGMDFGTEDSVSYGQEPACCVLF